MRTSTQGHHDDQNTDFDAVVPLECVVEHFSIICAPQGLLPCIGQVATPWRRPPIPLLLDHEAMQVAQGPDFTDARLLRSVTRKPAARPPHIDEIQTVEANPRLTARRRHRTGIQFKFPDQAPIDQLDNLTVRH